MATFNTNGLARLILDLEELGRLPAEVLEDMLRAGGEVVKRAQVRKIESIPLVDSRQLADSITVNPKMKSGRGSTGTLQYVTVYPKGKRREQRKGTNNDVAFVHEFGAPERHIPATQWMRLANEGCAEAAVQAEERVYHIWLNKKGL